MSSTNSDPQIEDPSRCCGLPAISKTALKAIHKRKGKSNKFTLVSGVPKASRKERKAPKPRTAGDWSIENQITTDAERSAYEKDIQFLESRARTLSEASVGQIGSLLVLMDSLSAAPCPHYVFTIPKDGVGLYKKENTQGPYSNYIGSFVNELSMMTFLIVECKLPRDHIIVRQTAEFYNINMETKYPTSTLQEYWTSIYNSKHLGGKSILPQPSQLGRSKKSIKKVFFYRNGAANTYPQNNFYIDTADLKKQHGYGGSVDFYDYNVFVLRDKQAREEKKDNSNNKNMWESHIKNVGYDQALQDLEDLRKKTESEAQAQRAKKKRSFLEASSMNVPFPEIVVSNKASKLHELADAATSASVQNSASSISSSVKSTKSVVSEKEDASMLVSKIREEKTMPDFFQDSESESDNDESDDE